MIKNSYSFWDILKLSYFLFRTKLIASRARLIRFPIEIRGRKFIDFGYGLTTGFGCRFEAYPLSKGKKLLFGNNVQVNDYVHISAMNQIKIGNNVLMASHIFISDSSHGNYKGDDQSAPDIPPIERKYYTAPVCIEDNVWLGEGVTVMPGVTIGHGSIIGANSIVTKNIPPNSIAVGSPAKIIKKYDETSKKWICRCF